MSPLPITPEPDKSLPANTPRLSAEDNRPGGLPIGISRPSFRLRPQSRRRPAAARPGPRAAQRTPPPCRTAPPLGVPSPDALTDITTRQRPTRSGAAISRFREHERFTGRTSHPGRKPSAPRGSGPSGQHGGNGRHPRRDGGRTREWPGGHTRRRRRHSNCWRCRR
jgi:hypothetical protein